MLVQGNRRIRNLLKADVGAVVEAVEKGNGPFSLRHLFAASATSELSTQGSSPRMYPSNPELLEVLYKNVSFNI